MFIVDVSDCPNSLYDGLYGGHSGDKEGNILSESDFNKLKELSNE